MEQVKKSIETLNEIVNSMNDDWPRKMCKAVLKDERFIEAPAAAKKHQAFKGGLVVHTAEVIEMALKLVDHPHIVYNREVLITAAIFHDYGKIWDYIPNPKYSLQEKNDEPSFIYTEHQKLVRHLCRSHAEFVKMCPVDNDMSLAIQHAILAHHGRKEWGSPIEPMSAEAYAIHAADIMSASYSITSKITV